MHLGLQEKLLSFLVDLIRLRSMLPLILILFFVSSCFAEENRQERAFYALSSLRYYFEEPDPQIFFDQDDVENLWSKALLEPSISAELKRIYQNESLETLQKQLKQLWINLQRSLLEEHPDWKKPFLAYTNFDGNPLIDKQMGKKIKPHLLPEDHSLKPKLDAIFSKPRVIENEQTFAENGFKTLFAQPQSFIRVAKHPQLPGVLVKVYLDNETRQKENIPGWKWLVNRCEGAENIRKLMQKKKFRHFCVPDKWLYPLDSSRQPVILVVTDMKLVSAEETENAWKTKVTKSHLEELYCILSHGYASCYLINNIPYTKQGKFACIDTEYPKRKVNSGMLKFGKVRECLSPEMQVYWNQLVIQGGKI